MTTNQHQSGSIHAIVAVLAAAALVGMLGYVYYQNAMGKNQPAAPAPVATASYCLPNEKLCFDYPQQWQVKDSPVQGMGSAVTDGVIVANADGTTMLRFQSGLYSVGGTCGEPGVRVRIDKTTATAIKGDYLIQGITAGDTRTNQVYAYQAISKNQDSTYTASMELNSSSTVAKTGEYDNCDLGMGIFRAKNIKYQGDSTWMEVTSATDPRAHTFKTEAEASAWLASDDAHKAYDVLRSVHY